MSRQRIAARTGVLGGLVLALSLGGCGASSYAQVASVFCKSQLVVAAQGGTLTVAGEECGVLAGTRVVIPPAALARDTVITVGVGASDIAPVGATGVGPAVDLGPNGTHFSYPATLTLPYTPEAVYDRAHLFVQEIEGTGATHRVEHVDLDIPTSGRTLSFQIRDFTQFEVAADDPCDPCAAGTSCCPSSGHGRGTCVDLSRDRANCGICGNLCGPGTSCVSDADGTGARCACDAADRTLCPNPSDGGSQCVDLLSDRNCGACGNACEVGAYCNPGTGGAAAQCECFGTSCPNQNGGGTACVDLTTDPSNCGFCGNACMDGYLCVVTDTGARCFGSCVGRRTLCYNHSRPECFDLDTDPNNCGACGHACDPESERCDSGSCVCAHGYSHCIDKCNPSCVDLQTSDLSCGSCRHRCDVGNGYHCVGGSCVL